MRMKIYICSTVTAIQSANVLDAYRKDVGDLRLRKHVVAGQLQKLACKGKKE